METLLNKKTIDDWLEEVDYTQLNSSKYVPSQFALEFITFIKLVNGSAGEANKSPPMHMKMLDAIVKGKTNLVNLCFRGASKALAITTPILTESGWSTMEKLREGDQIFGEDGKLTRIVHKSAVFFKKMYRIQLSDGRTLDVSEDHINVIIHRRVKRVNGKCVTYYDRREVTTAELLKIPLGSTRTKTEKSPKGFEASVWIPCNKPLILPERELPIDPYLLGLLLGGGSFSKTTGFARLHAHKDDFEYYKDFLPQLYKVHTDNRNSNVVSVGIKGIGRVVKDLGINVHGDFKFIPEMYLLGSKEQRLALLQGLMDTDGTVNPHKNSCTFSSNSIDLVEGVKHLLYSLGGSTKVRKAVSASGKDHYSVSFTLDMPVFRLPRKLKKQRLKLLGKVRVESIEEIPTVPSQCIAVDNASKTFLAGNFVVTHNTTLLIEYLSLYLGVFGQLPGLGKVEGMLYISDSMENGAKSARKNIQYRYENSEFLRKYIVKATFTDSYIEFVNANGHRLGIKLYGAKSGIRGTKVFGKRPVLAVLDDLLSDDDARSPTVISAIKDTIYRGVNHALDPKRRKIIMSGTPFNQEDPMIEAVESGEWEVSVYPVCENFPCSREDFVGAWEDRFSYDYVLSQYNLALSVGQVDGFYQELMLRINTSENRVIEEHDIRWYSRDELLKYRDRYNFYITTDFATSTKKKADYSVISVWAYSHTGNWFWIDGIVVQQTMEKSINDLFRLVQEYTPQSVGIEVAGQQGAFIQWIQEQMLTRNIWFTLASDKNSSNPGIRPIGDKLTRFNLVVPLFKVGKIAFPLELKTSTILGHFLKQLRLITFKGIKGKDDCIDTVSMLALLSPWKPYNYTASTEDKYSPYDSDRRKDTSNTLDSYIV